MRAVNLIQKPIKYLVDCMGWGSHVNALAEWLEVEVKRDGVVHHQRFEQGLEVTELMHFENGVGHNRHLYAGPFHLYP